MTAEVVLVHGMWHQAAHMEPLAEELRRRGVVVHVPELHRGSLAEDTSAVQKIVDACSSPPLVFGHSYGGAVITGLRGIRSLVYLAAYAPDAGESCASLGGALINESAHRHSDGGSFVDPDAARSSLYAQSDENTAAWATSLLVRQASGHGRGIPEHIAWHSVPSLYIVCARDRAIDPAVQREMSRRCTRSVEIEADHSPYISEPRIIADLIEQETRDKSRH